MRIKFGNKIFEATKVSIPGGDEGRFVTVQTSNGLYFIDCESPNFAKWLLYKMLKDGYFDATGVDYNNAQEDVSWFDYCFNKTEEQKVFYKWINGGIV